MEAIVSAVVGAFVTSVLGSALSKKNKAPQMPAMEKPTVMPDPNDEAVRDARRRSLAAQMARKGRASTILTDDIGGMGTEAMSEKLGG